MSRQKSLTGFSNAEPKGGGVYNCILMSKVGGVETRRRTFHQKGGKKYIAVMVTKVSVDVQHDL